MSYCPRNIERLNNVIKSFLERHKLADPDPGWDIRVSDVGGFGVFASRDFHAGEVIFLDDPAIIGPRCVPNCIRVCVVCYG